MTEKSGDDEKKARMTKKEAGMTMHGQKDESKLT